MRWNRVIPVLMAMLVSTSGGFCEAQFHFGTKGGLAISNHWSTEEKGDGYTVESSSKTGGSIGVLANYRISRYFTLQGEVLYTKKGSHQTVTLAPLPPPLGDIGAIELTYLLDYLEVPLILKTYPFKLETVKPYTTIGPYLAFSTGEQYELKNPALEQLGQQLGDDIGGTQDIEGLKGTDYGIVFGSGIEYQLYDLRLSFDYRYTMGFVDLTLPTGRMPQGIPASPEAFPEIKLRNNCHMFILGVIY